MIVTLSQPTLLSYQHLVHFGFHNYSTLLLASSLTDCNAYSLSMVFRVSGLRESWCILSHCNTLMIFHLLAHSLLRRPKLEYSTIQLSGALFLCLRFFVHCLIIVV